MQIRSSCFNMRVWWTKIGSWINPTTNLCFFFQLPICFIFVGSFGAFRGNAQLTKCAAVFLSSFISSSADAAKHCVSLLNCSTPPPSLVSEKSGSIRFASQSTQQQNLHIRRLNRLRWSQRRYESWNYRAEQGCFRWPAGRRHRSTHGPRRERVPTSPPGNQRQD